MESNRRSGRCCAERSISSSYRRAVCHCTVREEVGKCKQRRKYQSGPTLHLFSGIYSPSWTQAEPLRIINHPPKLSRSAANRGLNTCCPKMMNTRCKGSVEPNRKWLPSLWSRQIWDTGGEHCSETERRNPQRMDNKLTGLWCCVEICPRAETCPSPTIKI